MTGLLIILMFIGLLLFVGMLAIASAVGDLGKAIKGIEFPPAKDGSVRVWGMSYGIEAALRQVSNAITQAAKYRQSIYPHGISITPKELKHRFGVPIGRIPPGELFSVREQGTLYHYRIVPEDHVFQNGELS